MSTHKPSIWYVSAVRYQDNDKGKGSKGIDELLCQAMEGPEVDVLISPQHLPVHKVVRKIVAGDTFMTYQEDWSHEGPELLVVGAGTDAAFVKTESTNTIADNLEELPQYTHHGGPKQVATERLPRRPAT